MSDTSYTEITIPKPYAMLNLEKIATGFLGMPKSTMGYQLSDFNTKNCGNDAITFVSNSLLSPSSPDSYGFFINNKIPFLASFCSLGETPAGSICGLYDAFPLSYGVVELNQCPSDLTDKPQQLIPIDWEFQYALFSE